LDHAQDAFNYYLLQLQIRVEMAFGRLVNKFWIFSGKVGGSINRVSAILLACARLHNFIIRYDCPLNAHMTYDSIDDEMDALGICPT
jgi:hypothetical protein